MRFTGIEGDPSAVRREVQTRYSDYMGRRRLLLGVYPSDFRIADMGATPEDREAAYETFAARYPRKSQNLMRGVARELVFEGLSRRNHHDQVTGFHDALAESIGRSLRPVTFGYLSGLRRNACLLSVYTAGGGQEPARTTFVGSTRAIEAVALAHPEIVSLTIDPDYGMGDVVGPTPEIMASADGNEALMQATMGLLAEPAA